MQNYNKELVLFNSVKVTPSRKKPKNMIMSNLGPSFKKLKPSKTLARLPTSDTQLRTKDLTIRESSHDLKKYPSQLNRHQISKATESNKNTRLVEVNLDYESSINQIRKVVEEARKKSPARFKPSNEKS